jgi:hypothetical protein
MLASSGKMTVERLQETEEERDSRLRIKEEDAKADREEKKSAMDHRRRIEMRALSAYIGISGLACCACLWVLSDKTIAPTDKAWVGPTLTLIIGGLAGFLTGRLPGRTPEK